MTIVLTVLSKFELRSCNQKENIQPWSHTYTCLVRIRRNLISIMCVRTHVYILYSIDFDFNIHTPTAMSTFIFFQFKTSIYIYVYVYMNCETYKRTRPVILSVENDSEIEADQARTYRLIIHILSFLLYWKETLLLLVFNWYCLFSILKYEDKIKRNEFQLSCMFFVFKTYDNIRRVCFRVKI